MAWLRVAGIGLGAFAVGLVLAGMEGAHLYSYSAPAAVPVQAKPIAATARSVNYARDVAPILAKRCTTCHHPGDIGPMSLMDFESARKWAPMISHVTESKQMPPWKPRPGWGTFQNTRTMPDDEIAILKAWAAQGAPAGDLKSAPKPPVYASGWRLGTPDLILTMPKSFTVPAEGADPYRNFVLPTGLTKDRYVRAVEVRPGNRRVVHHVVCFLDASGQGRKLDAADGVAGDGYSGLGGMSFIPSGALPGYVPGDQPQPFPAGLTTPLKADSDVILSMHYHPVGKSETDQTQIGIYFADKPGGKTGSVILMGTLNIKIQPNNAAHYEYSSYRLPVDVELQGIGPHMHLIGKTVKLWAELPNGTVEKLIWIDDWEFTWQGTYRYVKPVVLPAGTVLKGEWSFDNTAQNPNNPSAPPRLVLNGENSTDEMAGVWMEVIVKDWTADLSIWGANLSHAAGAYLREAGDGRKQGR